MSDFSRTTVTAALIYANGPIHIGHLAGCYLPADIYVRYLRLQKKDVIFVSGTDEHGVPITIKAAKEGKGAAQLDGRMIDAASARMADNVVNIDKLINKK